MSTLEIFNDSALYKCSLNNNNNNNNNKVGVVTINHAVVSNSNYSAAT